jgi:opacity protein-like surface antigen
MKKICILATAALFSYTGATAQARFGLVGGVNLNQQRDHYRGETISNQPKLGFHAGGLVDICIAKNFTIQPGLMYILKGGLQQRTSYMSIPDGRLETKIKDKNNLSYIEMPLTFTYRVPAGTGHLVLGAGGYGSVLVDAFTKYKYKVSLNGDDIESQTFTNTSQLEIGDDANDDVNRWDAGLVASLGYEFQNGFFLRTSVDAGLKDIVNNEHANKYVNTLPVASDPTSKNVSWLLSLGYFFRH